MRAPTCEKRLRNFLRGDIMRWLWGRGSVGRAMRSQRIGQGFESPRLHHHKQTASRKRCRLLMAAKPPRERTGAQHLTNACRRALHFFRKRDDFLCAQVRRRRSRRFRPFPLPVACRSLSPKRTLSSLPHHYGEYPLVFTRGASHPWLTRVVRRRLVFPAQPPLFHGAATTIPHHLRFTSHPRYSVASLLTNPLVSTSRNLKRTTLSESSFRFFLVSLFYFQSNQENAANYN